MGLISSMIGFTLEIEDFIGESCIYNTQPYWRYIVKVRYSVYYPFPRVSFGEKKSFCFCQNGSPPFTVSRETIEDSGKERIRTEKVTQIAPVFFMYQQRIHWDNDEKKAVKSHAEVSIESELENGMKLWAVIRHIGSTSSGHYIVAIREETGWKLFNDKNVEKIQISFIDDSTWKKNVVLRAYYDPKVLKISGNRFVANEVDLESLLQGLEQPRKMRTWRERSQKIPSLSELNQRENIGQDLFNGALINDDIARLEAERIWLNGLKNTHDNKEVETIRVFLTERPLLQEINVKASVLVSPRTVQGLCGNRRINDDAMILMLHLID